MVSRPKTEVVSTLSRAARIYLVLICVSALVITTALLGRSLPTGHRPLWELLVLILLATLLGSQKIVLFRQRGSDGESSMSVGTTVSFIALFVDGPADAVLIGCASCLASCLWPKRQPLHQLAFNLALTALECWASGLTFVGLNGGELSFTFPRAILSLSGTALVYFLVNTTGVATIVGLVLGEKPWRIWQREFAFSGASFFASAAVSAMAVLLFGDRLGAMLLLIIPVALLVLQSFRDRVRRIEEARGASDRLAELYLSVIRSLALAVDAKDQYTHQHILRVQRYSIAIAEHLGMTGNELEGLRTSALLHDIGKLGVPDYVLLKPGRLTEDEFAKIKKHPEIGAAILKPVEFPWPVLHGVKYHHEKWDGSGYPEGLKGEDIPFQARILAVADVYDALTTTRSYRAAWPHEKAVAEIQRSAGTHFDPVIVTAFVAVIDSVVAQMQQEAQQELLTKTTSPQEDTATRDIQRVASDLWALYEVTQTLAIGRSQAETLTILGQKLETILTGAACVVFLRNSLNGQLQACTAAGVNRDFFLHCKPLEQTSRTATVLATQISYRGGFDPAEFSFPELPQAIWQPLFSALIVPMIDKGVVLGTINVYHPQPDAFHQRDQELLEQIAGRTAQALSPELLKAA